MEFTEYKRGVLGMKNPDGTSFGFLPETKEECITDDEGVVLSDKLANLKDDIDERFENFSKIPDGATYINFDESSDDEIIETLRVKDNNGVEHFVYPRTLTQCIKDENGNSFEDIVKTYIDTQLVDGSFTDKTYVAEQIAASNHLTKEIVTAVPTASEAKENMIYMLKVESATGNDKYQEYQLIGGNVVLVGDTSVDLSGYAKTSEVANTYPTKEEVQGMINGLADGTTAVGNADKLDGLSAENFIQTTQTTATDLNVEFENGVGLNYCNYNGSTTNTPYTEGLTNATEGKCVTFKGNSLATYAIQMALPYGDTRKVFVRGMANSSISSWMNITDINYVDYSGEFELRLAPDRVKSANKFKGETAIQTSSGGCFMSNITTEPSIGTIVYATNTFSTVSGGVSTTHPIGYYKLTGVYKAIGSDCYLLGSASTLYAEYLGTTYLVTQNCTLKEKIDELSNETYSIQDYTHPSYTAKTGVPTANQTPAFGGTFTVTQPVSDATGHITAMNSRTITIPSVVATTSKAGLQSASDKTKLDSIPNMVITPTDPGVGTSVSYADNTLIFVYEN